MTQHPKPKIIQIGSPIANGAQLAEIEAVKVRLRGYAAALREASKLPMKPRALASVSQIAVERSL